MIDVTGEAAQIIASVFTAVGLVVVAVITTRTRHDARAAREQVQNGHSTNLREELDDRHEETRGWFRGLARVVGGLVLAVAGVAVAVSTTHTRLVRVETHLQRGKRR